MSTEDKALELLGQNVPAEVVASALGVTPGRISQLLSDEEFAAKVSERRLAVLTKASSLDEKYNDLEDVLLERLQRSASTLIRPMEIVKVLQVVNGAKRRGVMAPPDTSTPGNKPVTIVLPMIIKQKFVTNVNNQILEVTDKHGQAKSLVTASATRLNHLVESRPSKEVPNSDRQETAPERSGAGSFRQTAITADDL